MSGVGAGVVSVRFVDTFALLCGQIADLSEGCGCCYKLL